MSKKMVMPVAWAQDVDCWLETLKAAGFSADTVRSRRYKIARLCRELPSPMETTGEQITRVFAAHDWKPETRKGYRNTIAGFYRWFYETGRRGDNPTAKVPKVKKPQAHPHPCPDKYILMALGKATEDERRMIRLAAECGLRRAEIAAVNSDDVMDDLLGKSLIVRGKGDKQRIVPCPDDLAAEIQACGGYLFPGRWSGHVESSYVGKHITRLLPDGWSAHSLRHRYATKTYEQTHDLFLVARLLGHSSVETTQIYVAMPDSRLRSALGAVRLAV